MGKGAMEADLFGDGYMIEPMVLAMADLVEPLEIPVRMIRRSSRVRCEKAFE